MPEKTLIEKHAEALEQVKNLTSERDAAVKLTDEAGKALSVEQEAHKATATAHTAVVKELEDAKAQMSAKDAEIGKATDQNGKLAFALAHPSFKALAAAGIADLPKQGGQAQDADEPKKLTVSEQYKAMKANNSDPRECAKFYEANKQAIREGK